MAASPGKEKAKGRLPRPRTVHFSCDALFSKWEKYALLRSPGFEFDGSAYGKPCRSLSSDVHGLIAHAGPLHDLVGLAPTAFPAQACVKDSLLLLQAKFKIFNCQPYQEEKRASEAADVWRVMCKDLYLLKKKQTNIPELQSTLDLIALPLLQSPSASSMDLGTQDLQEPETPLTTKDPMEKALDPSDVEKMFDGIEDPYASDIPKDDSGTEAVLLGSSDEGEEVHIMNVKCGCPACCGIPIPAPAIGGQKKETDKCKNDDMLLKPTMRLNQKTTLTAKMNKSHKKKKLKSQVEEEEEEQQQVNSKKDSLIKMPIVLINRTGSKSRASQMYILQNTSKNKYVIGQSITRSSNFKENIMQVAQKIRSSDIKTVEDAQAFLQCLP